jgi:spermidine/putrescine transport system substrate-binding protein
VTWPVYKDNAAIKSGLAPEQNATLRIFNWVAYLNPKVMKDFGKKYNCQVQLTTFQNMDDAMAKLRSGQLNFDVFFPTIDVMGELVYGKMIQPINHSYITNIGQAWPDFTDPFYDGKWQYTRSTRPVCPGVRTTSPRTRIRWRTRGRCPGRPSTRTRSRSWTTRGSRSASG